jgi:hypothetical protein
MQALFLSGFNLRSLISPDNNIVLVRRSDGSLGILLVHLHEVASPGEAEVIGRKYVSKTNQGPLPEINATGPVLQMMTPKAMSDFRTGLVIPSRPQPEEFRAMVLSALPLPPEFRF